MLKITQAPNTPVKQQQKLVIMGVADTTMAGKHLALAIDDTLKMVGPVVHANGSWHIDLAFNKPGNHYLAIALEKDSVKIPILVEDNSPPPPPPLNPAKTNSLSLEKLVREAYESNYSDVHLAVGKAPRFRHKGQIEITKYPEVDSTTFLNWLRELIPEEDIQEFKNSLDLDGAAQYDFARVRFNLFTTMTGMAMVLRLIPMRIPTLAELRLPEVLEKICKYQKGLVLVTGPTGSGKSTTLAAMINHINHNLPKHIITIEDPIEFIHKDLKSLISQREVGIHTQQFESGLKAALREDPDIILIGEMRDRETINIAIKAAQTGHLVFGTLHTNSAVKTIERILNLYEPQEQEPMRSQIAESLAAVISQGLIRTIDDKRAAFHEILINTNTMQEYIKRNDVEELEEMIRKDSYEGMCTINQSLYALYKQGRISEEIALQSSDRANELSTMFRTGW
jgi:twitching motility protein PilT